jgi:regulator of sigma E protease
MAAATVVTAVGGLLGNLGSPQVAGPIGIVGIVGQVRTQNPPIFLVYLIALLSANLAVINTLPIPPMDGGRVLVGVIKRIVGTRLSTRAEAATYLVGFGLLIAFILWISYFDITRPGGG